MSENRYSDQLESKTSESVNDQNLEPESDHGDDHNIEELEIPSGMKSIPSHWKNIKKIGAGTNTDGGISREAMESLGVPYQDLRLHLKVKWYYPLSDTDKQGRAIRKRVHLNPIPKGLLRVLYRSTPEHEHHWFLWLLNSFGSIEGDSAHPKYHRGIRAAMCMTDVQGNLREIPENLEKALNYDEKFFDQAMYVQKAIKAFYAPPRLRKIIYHTAPPEERCYYLVNEEERISGLNIDYPETDSSLRFRLMERRDEDGQLRELSDALERAIIDGEIIDEDSLADFDRMLQED